MYQNQVSSFASLKFGSFGIKGATTSRGIGKDPGVESSGQVRSLRGPRLRALRIEPGHRRPPRRPADRLGVPNPLPLTAYL